jgi:hypothetical protein
MYRKGQTTELKLVAIKTNNKVFISDNLNGESYHREQLSGLYFDGEKPIKTHHKDWFELSQLPEKIEKQLPAKRINMRFELKDGFQESELTPRVINETYIDEDSEYYEVKGLYDFKFETQPAGMEEVPFEINAIEEIDGEFEIIKTEYNLKHSILDKIQTRSIMLHTKPCSLSKQDSYNIIRNHVKANINPKYARVSSDYDFCFSVQKVIELYKPHEYTVDVNATYKRRKPKYEKRYNTNKTVLVYEAAPKTYNNYPVVEEFVGKDYEDLQNNIKTFLDNLMAEINEPVVECEHCKGRGVTFDEN